MNRVFRFLLILSCLAIFSHANAQFDDPQTLEIGPHGGVCYYMGDLNPTIPFSLPDLQYGGVVRYNYNSRWTFRFDYTHATVKGDDANSNWRPDRALNFITKINDFSLVAEFNFLEYYTGNPKRNVSPYIFGGISVFQYTPYADVDGQLFNLRDYNTEAPLGEDAKWYESLFAKSMPVSFSIPFGFGVKMSLSRHMAATIEWRMQKTFTDYLDDVKGVYPADDKHVLLVSSSDGQSVMTGNPTQLDPKFTLVYDFTDPSGKFHENQQRGNAAFDDWFGMARVSLTWKFNLPDGRGCNLSKF